MSIKKYMIQNTWFKNNKYLRKNDNYILKDKRKKLLNFYNIFLNVTKKRIKVLLSTI